MKKRKENPINTAACLRDCEETSQDFFQRFGETDAKRLMMYLHMNQKELWRVVASEPNNSVKRLAARVVCVMSVWLSGEQSSEMKSRCY